VNNALPFVELGQRSAKPSSRVSIPAVLNFGTNRDFARSYGIGRLDLCTATGSSQADSRAIYSTKGHWPWSSAQTRRRELESASKIALPTRLLGSGNISQDQPVSSNSRTYSLLNRSRD
jgi:hypothetical protein